jgi:hypothetical protein
MAKGWLIIGFAAGFVAGSAAGRKQFEKIKATATDLWERPEVQRTVGRVDAFVEDKAPAVHDVGAAVADSVSDSASENKPEQTGATS